MLEEWHTTDPSPWFDARVRAAVRETRPTGVLGRFVQSLNWNHWLAPASMVLLVVASVTLLRRAEPLVRTRVVAPSSSSLAANHSTSGADAGKAVQTPEQEVSLYKNLPILENYDMLAEFSVLSDISDGDSVAN